MPAQTRMETEMKVLWESGMENDELLGGMNVKRWRMRPKTKCPDAEDINES